MGYGVKLWVQGDYACFTRPEMKAERVSYDVITPSAARGILEAVYWHPGIKWVVDRITVLNEIKFDTIRRNELGSKIPPRNVLQAMKGRQIDLHQYVNSDRQQRAALLLRDVAYILEAHFEMVPKKAGAEDTPQKHYNIFLRRARKGQCFHQPYLGCREFSAHFRLLEENPPASYYAKEEHRDLGWMLWDILYKEHPQEFEAKFFRAAMCCGIVEVPNEVAL